MAKRSWRLIAVIATVAGVLGIAGGALAIGWASANTLVVADQQRVLPETVVIALPDYSADSSARMPDVRGLTEPDAQQALVDAGLPASIISVSSQPAAGPEGRIIQQMPVFGVANPASVVLVVSTRAEIPEVAGRPASEVIGEVQALGARVIQERVYEPDAEVGSIVSITPAEGSAVPETVTVAIADTPSVRLLTDFDAVGSSRYARTDYLHAGVTYDAAVEFSASRPDRLTDYAWSLGGRATLVETSLALADDSGDDVAATVIAFADGVELQRISIDSSSPQRVTWNVRQTQTLMLHVVRADPSVSGTVLLLDPEVKGSFEQMAATQ